MQKSKTLKEAIQYTIDKGKLEKSVEEMAEDIGVHPNLLYRWTAEEDSTSHADLPLRRLKSLMDAAGSLEILDYYERKFNRSVSSLRKFLSKPNKKNFDIVESALLDVMKKSACVKKYCDKKLTGQLEMDL